MKPALPSYDDCPRCGGLSVAEPDVFGEDSWLDCAGCGTAVVSWLEYKARAFAHVVDQARARGTRRQDRRLAALPRY